MLPTYNYGPFKYLTTLGEPGGKTLLAGFQAMIGKTERRSSDGEKNMTMKVDL